MLLSQVVPALWDCFSASQQRKFTFSKPGRSQKIGNFIEIGEKSVEKVVRRLNIFIIFLPQRGEPTVHYIGFTGLQEAAFSGVSISCPKVCTARPSAQEIV